MSDDLHDLLERFPAAYPHHGHHGVDLPWKGTYIIVTEDGDQEYMIGVYLGDRWPQGHEPDAVVVVIGLANAITLVEDLTGLTPEGVDFGAWALQWIADAAIDGRIAGELNNVRDEYVYTVGALLAQLEDIPPATALAAVTEVLAQLQAKVPS